MLPSNLKKTNEFFTPGTAPQLLYVTRQEFGIERPIHTHDTICELVLVYDGTGIYNIDQESYSVQKGDLIFYNAGSEHELLSESGGLSAYCLGYINVFFRNLPRNCLIPHHTSCISPSGELFTLLKELAEKILELNIQDQIEQSLIDSLATSFLLLAHRNHFFNSRSQSPQHENDLIRQVKDYIAAHLTEDIRLQDIADALAFSPSHISHTFRKGTGYSPIEYLIRRRIGYAETLLISSDMSVTHIATLCGYDSPNHFQTVFKKMVGITPLQYRKKYLAFLHGSRKQ